MTTVLDAPAIGRSLIRIAHEILESTRGTDGLVLVGIINRGDTIARHLATMIKRIEGVEVPVVHLDITDFRDDARPASAQPARPAPGAAEGDDAGRGAGVVIPDLTGKKAVLVDDVLYTGRTARAAMDALLSAGRPSRIWLAVLVDRGHRELPIRADFVGKNVPTHAADKVVVKIEPTDKQTSVEVVEVSR
ncbi:MULTISPECIES: bifunctional pyr operon transcriptional regulator/uracil phosphoribosyltransferase PyrR [Trueperella]|uniref:Bifunctional protein PyrR n=1 Tax=Trueperella bernardiae TaxID=59561 RepID=A0A0W1KJ76_9ACTO|nr:MULTISPECIES: bifunctional pyr operon transcriptional regulator/uracil phosphoribosyltransferase PyrR [Trueperella]KTF03596.1 Bifunctional protein PyrR [Trueperella bernardiae]MCM3907861.1 bifunctional pyr operon transcriptional regulator/uracil phosphoribosyltransferase PyrR [Trueperella bernardiae]MDK8600864.1 bifunctional pyr operon transcriptional regulator/uracil phosphoribosyltransferase PyrR [Trueperella bernardiae]OCW60595.1 hypothetical protein AKG36_02505 [Trueperella bernardiae]O